MECSRWSLVLIVQGIIKRQVPVYKQAGNAPYVILNENTEELLRSQEADTNLPAGRESPGTGPS